VGGGAILKHRKPDPMSVLLWVSHDVSPNWNRDFWSWIQRAQRHHIY